MFGEKWQQNSGSFDFVRGQGVDGQVLDVGEEVVDDGEVDGNVGDHVDGSDTFGRSDTFDAARTVV